MVKKVIAIIPARGGSKRIPHKNIIDFCDKPMIAWTIQAALQSHVFTDVIVSTDSQEIAHVAQEYGATVPFLRDKFADDHATVSDVTIYTLEELEKRLEKKYDIVVQLMPNCPLRTGNDIRGAYDNFCEKEATFQISCFKFGWMNPWWSCELDKDFSPQFKFPEALKKRSQDLSDLYCPTGAIWMANIEALKKEKSFYSKPLVFFPISWQVAMDIDTYEDLAFAKGIYFSQTKQL